MNDAMFAEASSTDRHTGTLSFHALEAHIVALAERMVERCGYEVTGLVLADKTRRRMGVVDGAYPKTRWFPETKAFLTMMAGGPAADISVAPAEAAGDALLDPCRTPTAGLAPYQPAHATADHRQTLDPLVKLATDLGCFPIKNADGATTWGLPGHAIDYPNPANAIKELFALRCQGKVDARQLSML